MAKVTKLTNDGGPVRWQILCEPQPKQLWENRWMADKIENFTSRQRRRFEKRCGELKMQGVAFTVWDCERNPLADLFRIG